MDGRIVSASAARRVALETVTRVRQRAAYAHETFDAVVASCELDQRDIAFAARLAYGTIAMRGTLDEVVGKFVRSPSTLEPAVGDALALAAYELLFMSTPARAAVSQGVELVRSHRSSAAGLANAVLRRVAEQVPSFPWGDPASDIGALARLHGHPEWMAQRLVDEYGIEVAASIMAADNEPAPLYLASLPTSGTLEDLRAELERDGAQPEPCSLPGCVVAGDPSAARRSSAVTSRRCLVMDAGAQFVVRTARTAPGSTVVELGAGRGSKSLLLASVAAADEGKSLSVVAVDLHAHKLQALEAAAAAMGLGGIRTVVADAVSDDLGIEDGTADAVLVDAPCSGLGTLRRHPDRRWRARPQEVTALAALGTRLLERAARLVRPGGFVVYSTCTILSEENGDVVSAFLGSELGKDFATDSLAGEVPTGWEGFVTPEGWVQSLPAAGGPDGHFVARLTRR